MRKWILLLISSLIYEISATNMGLPTREIKENDEEYDRLYYIELGPSFSVFWPSVRGTISYTTGESSTIEVTKYLSCSHSYSIGIDSNLYYKINGEGHLGLQLNWSNCNFKYQALSASSESGQGSEGGGGVDGGGVDGGEDMDTNVISLEKHKLRYLDAALALKYHQASWHSFICISFGISSLHVSPSSDKRFHMKTGMVFCAAYGVEMRDNITFLVNVKLRKHAPKDRQYNRLKSVSCSASVLCTF